MANSKFKLNPTSMQIEHNTMKPRQNGRHFADDIFKCIFLNEYVWILIAISLKFVPKCPINNIPALGQIMIWHQPATKPLSEPMMALFTDAYMHHSASMSLHVEAWTIWQFCRNDFHLSWKKMVIWMEFHWILFLIVQLALTQHWFREWLGVDRRQAIPWNNDD